MLPHCQTARTAALVLLLAATARADLSGVIARNAPRIYFRHPVAMVLVGERLLVANRRAGSLSRIDVGTFQVLGEKKIGKSLSDLVMLGSGRLLATDQRAGQVIVLSEHGMQVMVHQRLDVATSPVTIAVSPGGGLASVASLWARRLTFLNTREAHIERIGTVDLPFAPRLQCFLPDGYRLVVADAFGGQLAIVDTISRHLVSLRSIDAHNIRGLTLSDDGHRVLIAHQLLDSRMPTTRQRVFWGQVVSNLLRSVAIDELLRGQDDPAKPCTPQPIAHWTLEPLGESKNAAGDPGQIVMTPSGKLVVCLGGVNQIAVSSNALNRFRRVGVGYRPMALAVDPRRSRVYVANMHDDSISVVDVEDGVVVRTISLGRTPEMSLADQGERLFYDARISLDGWYSCHSCHTDGHTNGLLNDNFGDDVLGTPKRVLSLLGVNTTGPWGWNGQQLWISTQVAKSVRTTMRHEAVEALAVDGGVEAIADFLRSLEPPPSLLQSRGESRNTPAIRRGREIFARNDCGRCHAPSAYTSSQVYNVGLVDEAGVSEFNPPSLRGVSQRNAWFHDNRAGQLRDVFAKHGHPNESTSDLSSDEIDDLVQFLKSL